MRSGGVAPNGWPTATEPDSESHPSVEQAKATPLSENPKINVASITGVGLLNIISCSLNIKLFEATLFNYTAKRRSSRTFEWYELDKF